MQAEVLMRECRKAFQIYQQAREEAVRNVGSRRQMFQHIYSGLYGVSDIQEITSSTIHTKATI